MLFVLSLLIVLGINFILFLIAYNRQSDKLTDFAYALSFISVTVVTLLLRSKRSMLLITLSVMVLVWALRLGGFLVYRIRKSGRDSRFDSIRQSYLKFLQFWLGQGIVAWILLLPVLFLSGRSTLFSPVSLLGIAIWLMGLVVEAVADQQKYRFKQDPANMNRWIDKGLWHYSRHPNYFGEISIWVGIYLAAFPALSLPQKLLSLVSPLSIFVSLMFISGVPILEQSADKRWGKDTAYQAYKARTSLILPLWNRK